jgi:Methylamine utilisation protein MauE
VTERLYYALQLALGVVFFLAAGTKLRRPRRFARVVAVQGLVPVGAASPAAWTVVALESAVAFALLTGWQAGPAAVVATLLLAAFATMTVVNLRRRRMVPCGCFGSATEMISARSLVRLGMLVGAGVALVALWATGTQPVTLASIIRGGSDGAAYLFEVASLSVALLLTGLWALHLPEIVAVFRRIAPPPPAVPAGADVRPHPVATADARSSTSS